jgi:hypothetical protein
MMAALRFLAGGSLLLLCGCHQHHQSFREVDVQSVLLSDTLFQGIRCTTFPDLSTNGVLAQIQRSTYQDQRRYVATLCLRSFAHQVAKCGQTFDIEGFDSTPNDRAVVEMVCSVTNICNKVEILTGTEFLEWIQTDSALHADPEIMRLEETLLTLWGNP